MESIVLGLELPKFSGGSEENISATVSKSEINVACENKLESTAISQTAAVPETLKLVDGKTYSQIQYKLKIKPIKPIEHSEKCWDCEALLSQWKIEKIINNVSEGFAYNCDSCLKEHTIPAYKAQGAVIDLELPTLTQEAFLGFMVEVQGHDRFSNFASEGVNIRKTKAQFALVQKQMQDCLFAV